jgi:glutamate racemase
MNFLRSFDLKAVLIACGTVSTTALYQLRQENDIPVLGVVEPTCRRAVNVTKNKKVGLIATRASIRSGTYERVIHEMDPEVQVLGKACPLFVPLVENGRVSPGDIVIETVAREYLQPMKEQGLDTLILGCTHYPLLTEIIADIMGDGVELINVGQEAAWEMKRTLERLDLLSDAPQGETTLYASDRPNDFAFLAGQFLQEQLQGTVRSVNIEQY